MSGGCAAAGAALRCQCRQAPRQSGQPAGSGTKSATQDTVTTQHATARHSMPCCVARSATLPKCKQHKRYQKAIRSSAAMRGTCNDGGLVYKLLMTWHVCGNCRGAEFFLRNLPSEADHLAGAVHPTPNAAYACSVSGNESRYGYCLCWPCCHPPCYPARLTRCTWWPAHNPG